MYLDDLMPVIREQLDNCVSVRIEPRGTSMMPMIREGFDSVVLSKLPEKPKKYDVILYQRRNGQYVLHRLVKVGETYTFIGDNQFDSLHLTNSKSSHFFISRKIQTQGLMTPGRPNECVQIIQHSSSPIYPWAEGEFSLKSGLT